MYIQGFSLQHCQGQQKSEKFLTVKQHWLNRMYRYVLAQKGVHKILSKKSRAQNTTTPISIFKECIRYTFLDRCGFICTGSLWKLTQGLLMLTYRREGQRLEGRVYHFEFSLLYAFFTFEVQKIVFNSNHSSNLTRSNLYN